MKKKKKKSHRFLQPSSRLTVVGEDVSRRAFSLAGTVKAPDSLKLCRTIQINKQVSKRGKSQLSPLKTFTVGITPGSFGPFFTQRSTVAPREPGVHVESHPGPLTGTLVNVQVEDPFKSIFLKLTIVLVSAPSCSVQPPQRWNGVSGA